MIATNPHRMSRIGTHWLVRMARQLGLPGSEVLPDLGRTPTAAVWEVVARGAGLSDADMARQVACHHGLPVADLTRLRPQLMQPLPEGLARRFGVCPIEDDGVVLTLATCDPVDPAAEQAVAFAVDRPPRYAIASPARLREAIDRCYAPDEAVTALLDALSARPSHAEVLAAVGLAEGTADGRPDGHDVTGGGGGPVTRLTNAILHEAIRDGASEVHFEPGGTDARVRFRVDGLLRERLRIPCLVHSSLIARLKVIAALDVPVHDRPQDGHALIRVGPRGHHLRVSTVPTLGTEKAVIRVRDPYRLNRLAALGVAPEALVQLERLLQTSDGIVCVTGPTKMMGHDVERGTAHDGRRAGTGAGREVGCCPWPASKS